jgi:hypothetical protein
MSDHTQFPCTTEGCINTVAWAGRGRYPKYCNDHRAYRTRPAALEALTVRSCVECDKTYAAVSRDTCSEKCRDRMKWRERAALIPKQDYYCQSCDSRTPLVWSGKGRHPVTCSGCKRRNRTPSPRRPRVSPAPVCATAECGRDAKARGMCTACYKRWARAEGMMKPETRTDRHREKEHRRRARKFGSGVSDHILARDLKAANPTPDCCLCDQPIDMALSYPDRMSWSLEHLTPLSLGGSHTRDNVAESHLRCNVLRRVTPIAEYRASLGLDRMADA